MKHAFNPLPAASGVSKTTATKITHILRLATKTDLHEPPLCAGVVYSLRTELSAQLGRC